MKSSKHKNIYDINVTTIEGEEISLALYSGKTLLIVNVASNCGFTSQYVELEKLYKKYRNKNFAILAFPCNQFFHQESGTNSEIKEFCQLNFNVTFQLFSKIDVNGKDTHPLYKFLKEEKDGFLSSTIKWNFTKFLVSSEGIVLERYAPIHSITQIESDINKTICSEVTYENF